MLSEKLAETYYRVRACTQAGTPGSKGTPSLATLQQHPHVSKDKQETVYDYYFRTIKVTRHNCFSVITTIL